MTLRVSDEESAKTCSLSARHTAWTGGIPPWSTTVTKIVTKCLLHVARRMELVTVDGAAAANTGTDRLS